mgnify:FL=1
MPAALVAALSMVLCVMMTAAPAQAHIAHDGYVWLHDDGGDTLAATDWRFYVEVPHHLNTDAESWDFTIYSQLVNSTGTAAAGQYGVVIYVDNGIINRSVTSTLTTSLDGIVYGNVSMPRSTLTLFAPSDDATVFVELKSAAVAVDSHTATVPIYGSETVAASSAAMVAMVGVFGVCVTLVVVVKMFGLVKVWGKK